jgi:hypothetical protein
MKRENIKPMLFSVFIGVGIPILVIALALFIFAFPFQFVFIGLSTIIAGWIYSIIREEN